MSVVAGVLVAVAFALVVPLEWWSLGLLILVSITIGQVLRLRANLIEVAISGMLVLGVGSLNAESAAWQRIAETLVGAAVGVAANLLFPPKVATADAGRAIYGLAASVGELLKRAAGELEDHVGEDRELASAAEGWLGDARRITYDIPPIGAVLVQAEEGRRLNVRALGTADVGPGLRQGLEALEHSAVAIRGMFRGVLDATREAGGSTTRAPRTCSWDSPRRSASLLRPSRRSGSWSRVRPGRREPSVSPMSKPCVRLSTASRRHALGSTTSSWPTPTVSCSSCTRPCCPR